jgi:hypothetical protein
MRSPINMWEICAIVGVSLMQGLMRHDGRYSKGRVRHVPLSESKRYPLTIASAPCMGRVR